MTPPADIPSGTGNEDSTAASKQIGNIAVTKKPNKQHVNIINPLLFGATLNTNLHKQLPTNEQPTPQERAKSLQRR